MNKDYLKRRLIKLRGHRCEKCKLTEWLNSPIPLQLHHMDGNTGNNTEKNGELLCPNCHALTKNYCGKNISDGIQRKTWSIKNEEVKIVIPRCQSIKEVLTVVGLKTSGANYKRARRIMSENNLSLLPYTISLKELEARLNTRKVIRPSKDELEKLVWEKPTVQIAKNLNVSDKAISKWCDYYGIKKPERGFWTKQKHLSSTRP